MEGDVNGSDSTSFDEARFITMMAVAQVEAGAAANLPCVRRASCILYGCSVWGSAVDLRDDGSDDDFPF